MISVTELYNFSQDLSPQVTPMRSLMREMPYLGPARKPFQAKPMKEGLRPLRSSELRKAFSAFSRSSDERYGRFMAARSLVKDMGGSVDIVSDSTGTLRLNMSLAFPTGDKNMDPELFARVAGMGFDLSLESRLVAEAPDRTMAGRPRLPYMSRSYVISERCGSDRLEHADGAAERLAMLGSELRAQEPDNVIQFKSRSEPSVDSGPNRLAASGSR